MNHETISVLAGAARAILAFTGGGTCLGAAFSTEGGTSAASSIQPLFNFRSAMVLVEVVRAGSSLQLMLLLAPFELHTVQSDQNHPFS